MTAFVSFVRTFAIWIYLFCAFGILLGIKMLVDARHLSRTTLFSLEQERAGEQTYRALILIIVFLLIAFASTAVNLVGGALVPAAEPPILRGPTPTLPAIVFPTNTPVPTLTRTPLPPTETPFLTATSVVTATVTRAKPTAPPTLATAPAYPLPAPTIVGPLPNDGTWIGEGQANAAITFKWQCEKCVLGPNDWYEVVITYVDKAGAPKTIAGRTRDDFLSLRRILDGGPFEIYQKAKEDTFQWYVQVKRDPNNQPLSPPSDKWKFVWK